MILDGWLLQHKAFPTKDDINAGKNQNLGWDNPLTPEYIAEQVESEFVSAPPY